MWLAFIYYYIKQFFQHHPWLRVCGYLWVPNLRRPPGTKLTFIQQPNTPNRPVFGSIPNVLCYRPVLLHHCAGGRPLPSRHTTVRFILEYLLQTPAFKGGPIGCSAVGVSHVPSYAARVGHRRQRAQPRRNGQDLSAHVDRHAPSSNRDRQPRTALLLHPAAVDRVHLWLQPQVQLNPRLQTYSVCFSNVCPLKVTLCKSTHS